LLATEDSIIGLRVAQGDPPGASQVKEQAIFGGSGLQRDTPYQAMLVKLPTGSNRFRNVMLRGTPDARIAGGNYSSQAAYDAFLRAYFTQLRNDGALMLTFLRTNPLTAVVSVSATGLLTLFAAETWPTQSNLRFFRTKTLAGKTVRGDYKIITRPSDTTAQLQGWPVGDVVAKGIVRLIVPLLLTLGTEEFPPRIRSRKVGRPFGQPVGRVKSRG
jgi:hypothetical protein